MLKVGFVGQAGKNNMQDDITSFLKQTEGISFVGLADAGLYHVEAQSVVKRRLSEAEVRDRFNDCKVVASMDKLLKLQPDLVFIGAEPTSRGHPKCPMELRALQAGCHVFVEKPISVAPSEEFAKYLKSIRQAQKETRTKILVGHSLRHFAAMTKLKQLVKDAISTGGDLQILSVFMRYSSSTILPTLIDSDKVGVDILMNLSDTIRYICGEVNLDSIRTTCPHAKPAETSVNENGEKRTSSFEDADDDSAFGGGANSDEGGVGGGGDIDPTLTATQFIFVGGALGTLIHRASHLPSSPLSSLSDSNGKASSALEIIYTNGIEILVDNLCTPNRPSTITLRDPNSKKAPTVFNFPADNKSYTNLVRSFVTSVRTSSSRGLLSTYDDVAKTYELMMKFKEVEESSVHDLF